MATANFKYDVAFSFLDQDEALAIQINDLLQDRLKTFLYSQKQKEIAGKDGEEVFNRVFGAEARTVFVLYRKSWGETSWTRIEQTAIRNRAFEKGYDFVVFAPLDKYPTVPEWLPKNRVWVGLDRWGIKGATIVIEARVQEAGGQPKEETVEDRAKSLSRKIAAEKARQIFLGSRDGVNAADKALVELFNTLEKVVSDLSEKDGTSVSFKKQERECVIYADSFSISLDWEVAYHNSLQNSVLYLSLWQGAALLSGESSMFSEKPKIIKNNRVRLRS